MKAFRDMLTRRAIFTGGLRYATLGVLCAVAGVLAAKWYRLSRNGTCINHGLCRSCKAFERCRLPLALAAKKKTFIEE